MNLSGVQTIITPANTYGQLARGIAVLANGTNSLVDLSGLTYFGDAGVPSTSFMQVTNGGQILVPNLQSLMAVGLNVSGGLTLRLPSLTNYSGGSGSSPILQASGAASVLDLPVLQTVQGPSEQFQTLTIQALGGGHLNLSGVQTIITPANTYGQLARGIAVLANGTNSLVDLSGLTYFGDAGVPSTSFMQVTNGGQILVPNLQNLVGVSLYVSGGLTLNLPALTNSASSPSSSPVLQSSGVGSLLILTNLQTFTGPGTMSQTNGGLILLNSNATYQNVSFQLAPVILSLPQSAFTVGSGLTVTYSIWASGTLPTYQWLSNNIPVVTGTSATFVLNNVQPSWSGSGYSVIIANAYGSVTSSVVTLTVPSEPLYTAVNGYGQIQVSPAASSYYLGQTFTLTAVPARYNMFTGWSDGLTNNPRAIVINSNNAYTASFANAIPMDTYTNGGVTFQVPAGTPVVLVNGQYSPTNYFAIPVTNTIQVTLLTSFPNGYIFYTLDGTDPDFTSEYYNNTPFSITQSAVIRAIAYNYDGTIFQAADPLTITIVPIYTLTDTTPGGGSTAFTPAGGVYLSNTVVTSTATASNGWTFMGWQGLTSSTNNPVTVTVNNSTNISAVFGTTITTTTNVVGASVALWPAQGPYPYSSTVRLVGVPPAGKAFSRWFNVFLGPTNNPYDLVMTNANPLAGAFFGNLAANNYTITTLLNGYGEVTRSPAANAYAANTTVQLTAVPDAGYLFINWSGDANGSANPVSVTLNTNKVVTAVFMQPAAPTIVSQPQSLTVSLDSNAVFTVNATGVPIPVYQWYFNGTNLPGATSATLNIASVQAANVGAYFVIVTNSLGSVTSSVALLNLPPVTNQPPLVAITSPISGTTFTAPANVAIVGNASDTNANGTIAQIVLLGGANTLTTTANSSFNFTWANAPIGTNTLTAIATDNFGLSATSAVTFVVQPSTPQVVLVSPTNGNVFYTPASVLVSAIASDADNALGHVEFYSGDLLLSSVTNPPFNFTWNNVSTGSYTLTALAIDTYGPMATSAPVNITITLPPSTNPPVFLFSATSYSVNESNGTVVVTVLNNGDLGGLVNYTTADGTAFGGSGYSGSYTIAQGALNFASGQHSTNITISIIDNFITGADIQFSVQLFNPSAGTLGTPATTTVTIHQNDIGGAANSLLTTASPSAQPSTSGALTMVLTPQDANGQWRFPWEQGWHQSGYTETSLQAGNYPVEFQNVPNYLAVPASVSIPVTNGATTIVTNALVPGYTSLDTNSTGSLTVNIGQPTPSGACWRFIGETTWRSPNTAASGLLPDTYFIQFEPVNLYSSPASQAVQIFSGQGTIVSVNYQLAASLPTSVSSTPSRVSSSLITDVRDFPYGFNGQLYTDVGYGSGVAVRESVVLTAAHMVFNDATLAYVNQAYWSFQEEADTFSPEPIAARGWYVLSGYAAQRTNDLQVGGYGIDASSPQSRNLDVAALYFLSPAARGGYGGYLASDASPNPWLTGSSLKMLVGYPVDGSEYGQTVQPGMMYVTGPQTTALTLASNNVYSGSWFLSYPGNSGGPLYVQFNGYYYPAAVYLGSVGSGQNSVSVVRAINSEVVNLINLAASEGDAGTNYTGGGVITLIAGALSSSNPAYVQVWLAPPAAVAAGAGWKLAGDSSYGTATNYTRSVTTNGATIQFKPVAGWNTPTNQGIHISAGTINVITNVSYTVVPPTMVADSIHGIALSGTTGTIYRLEYRTNLVSGQWLPLKTNTLGTGINTLLPWPPTNGAAAFYRVVWLP